MTATNIFASRFQLIRERSHAVETQALPPRTVQVGEPKPIKKIRKAKPLIIRREKRDVFARLGPKMRPVWDRLGPRPKTASGMRHRRGRRRPPLRNKLRILGNVLYKVKKLQKIQVDTLEVELDEYLKQRDAMKPAQSAVAAEVEKMDVAAAPG
ncbi:hypothetical protein HDU97_003831 [Phlyctochytrium planicorne]|nr:hypothetical protein HDU97_003831 [Phlyctochytrium planicorne]